MSNPCAPAGQSTSLAYSRDFLNSTNEQIFLRGHQTEIDNISTIIDQGYNRKLIYANRFWSVLTALEVSVLPICESLGLAPLKSFEDFLRLRLSGTYARWAYEASRNGGYFDNGMFESLMDPNSFSTGGIAKLISLAGQEFGQVFRLGVCSKSKEHERTWDLCLYPASEQSSVTYTIWLINNEVGGTFNDGDGVEQEAAPHWSGLCPSSLNPVVAAPAGLSTEGVSNAAGSVQDNDIRRPRPRPTRVQKGKEPDRGSRREKGKRKTVIDPVMRAAAYNYRNVNEAPPINTRLPEEHMSGITPEELWVYFPNHAQDWPNLALQLVNSRSKTTGKWQWLEDCVNESRLQHKPAHDREKWALHNTINKKMTAAVAEALNVEKWDKRQHEPLSQHQVEQLPRQPPARMVDATFAAAWPLWRIGANLIQHTQRGVFTDRVKADMRNHPAEVDAEFEYLAKLRGQTKPAPPFVVLVPAGAQPSASRRLLLSPGATLGTKMGGTSVDLRRL